MIQARARLLVLGLILASCCTSAMAAGLATRWMGQDGKDYVGQRFEPGPSDVVDVHIAVDGLPRQPIEWVELKGNGGGAWHSNQNPVWLLKVVRTGTSPRADLYFEPYQVEKGRDFGLQIKVAGAPPVLTYVKGGKADPNLRVASAKVLARWGGMTTEDRAGSGPNVGPDGLLDARISFANLSAKDEVRAIQVRPKTGNAPGWSFGVNHELAHNAEFAVDPKDRSKGELWFQPDRDLTGQPLAIKVIYASGNIDLSSVVAGKTVPAQPVARVTTPVLLPVDLRVSWLGQDGTKRHGIGDVHLKLDGIPAARAIVAAELSDPTGAAWVWKSTANSRFEGDVDHGPLALAKSADGWHAAFPPTRDETGSMLTLRLAFADGRESVTVFPGGKADPSLRSPMPSASAVDAKPGDDLQALVNRHGLVKLAAGIYRLERPLVLRHPVTITSDAGATLEFVQPANAPGWTAAIKIQGGNTTLDHLAIKFPRSIRWDRSVGHGPAVIGTTDDKDPAELPRHLFGIRLTRLNIDSPAASSDWEEAPNSIRLTNAQNGVLEGNTIRGGAVEFWGGPWRIVGNTYTGTPPKTHMPGVFCGHFTHDLLVEKNTARPVGPSGKTYRFLVLTQRGYRDVVRDNIIEGLGARADDPRPHPNMPEVVLTEAYRIRFEGKPLAVSADGRILKTPKAQAGPIASGDVLAILTGPHAGEWRLVSQPMGVGNLLLDAPLPTGTEKEVVSVVTGFVQDRFENNLVDSRGSDICFNLVLAGNHFGLTVKGNRLIGAGESFKLMAPGSETPGIWGWSHAPMFGVTFEGNHCEDAWNGGNLGVEHSAFAKSAKGRVYFVGTLSNNTFAWTDEFSSRRVLAKGKEEVAGVTFNYPTPFDPNEVVITERGNTRRGASWIPAARVVGARVNGQTLTGRTIDFAAASSARTGSPVR